MTTAAFDATHMSWGTLHLAGSDALRDQPMTPCPSDETFADLLADGLGKSDADALAEHVEKCALCQRKMARLTESSSDESWRRGGLHPTNETEDEIVRRLKGSRHLLTIPPPDSSDTPTIHSAQGKFAASATFDFEIPSVPGYEIIGILGRGGAGVVFKARHLGLHRMVALKMLQNWKQPDEKELARFRAE